MVQSLLLYRFNRLDGARQKAKSYDPPYSGTMFPWESAFSGVETCPTSAATGFFRIRIWTFWLFGLHCDVWNRSS
jgi:trehalose/maltose hydrolase-like predicted phosphorylase